MGKALKTAGAIIGGAVLIATGVGALAGLNVAAMGVASFTGSLTIGQLGMISAGMSAVGGMLDKPKSSGAAPATDWTANEDQPTPFAFGRVGVAGKIVHWDEYGKDNKLKSFVSVYSGAGPIKGFVSFKAGDLPVTFASNGGTAIGKYNRQMWRSWKVGTQPDTALPLPTGLDEGAVMPQWGGAYKLSGKACDLWTLQQDSKLSVYPGNAEPKPLTVLEGVFGYDPRKDSTYPGGFGDCRLDDRSTWPWISCPIIAGLNWALGMRENGQVVGGIGASPSGIDFGAFVECANIAEANGWGVSAWPDTSQDASVVLDQFLQAGGAVRARHAGKISCVSRGAARPSIVTITRRDTAGAIELDTGASAFNRLNTITPRIMSEARGWKLWPADPVTFAALREEDGGKRGDKVDYPFVPIVKQGAQLAAYDILDAREPFAGTIPLKPHLRRLKRGDCFDIDEPGFLLDGVKCIVLSRSYDPSKGEVRIAFRSETDGKHDLALGKTTTLPEYPVLTPSDPTLVSPPLPEDWVIVPSLPGEDGVQVPVLDIIGEVSNGTATAVHFEWSLSPDGPWTSAGIWPPTVTSVSVPVTSGSQVWIGVSYRRGDNFSERVVSGPYTAGDLIAGGLTPNAAEKVVRDVLDQIDEIAAGTEAAEQVAELVLETILNENDALVKEAKERGEGIAIAYQGATQYADGKVAEATLTMATIAMLDAAQAATLTQSQSYTDGYVATALNTVYTKAQVDSGLSTTLQQARSYSDAKASEASLLFATKAERENGDAATYASMKSYVDAYKSEANLLFAAQSSLNGVSATAALALSTAQDANTKLNEARLRMVAAASGGKPAVFEMYSGTAGGSYITISAEQIGFGANSVFDDATDTIQTVINGRRRVIAWGAPFGAGSNLLEWWGPSNIALSAMTTANGDNGRMTFSPYVFDNVIASKSGGARAFDGQPGWLSATTTIPNMAAGTFITISGRIEGGTFGGPVGQFYVTLTLTETDAGGTRTILTTSAVGHAENDPDGGGYHISIEPAWSATGQGLKGGSVTYALNSSVSGPGYASNGTVRGSITVLPQI